MVWVLRICVGLLVLAYAAWLAWPVLDLATQGVDPTRIWVLATGSAGAPGAAVAGLWCAIALLYAIAGVLTGAGLTWAPGAYFLAFAGEILFRLSLVDRPAPDLIDIAARTAAGLRQSGLGLDPAPMVLGGLLAMGLLVLALGVWRGRGGAALTRSWTQAPAWS